jgi:hypothetical protein
MNRSGEKRQDRSGPLRKGMNWLARFGRKGSAGLGFGRFMVLSSEAKDNSSNQAVA